MKRTLVTVLLLSVAGCSAKYTEPELGADHPASAAAPAATLPAHSATLDLAAAEAVAPVQPGTNHSGHGDEGSPAAATERYACPMHPEVTSDKPDQRCPKCGMKLKNVEKSEPGSTGGSK